MNRMSILEEWEKSLPSQNTKDHHLRGLRYFGEFIKKDPKTLLKERRRQYGKSKLFETQVLEFFKWLQEMKGMTSNSARSYIIGVQSFFSYFDVPLKLKRKLPNLHMKLDARKVTPEDLRKLFKYNDLTIKTWLALSRDCPARISDLIEFKREQIRQREFLIQSKKEGVVGKVFLSEETIDLFERFWKTVPESEYAFSTPTGERYDPSGINKMLKRACKKAGVEDLKITQHSFRKLWYTTAVNGSIQEIKLNILTFKSVPQSQLTYFLEREELGSDWKKVIELLSLEPQANGRINSIQEIAHVAAEALSELLEPIIEKKLLALQASRGGETLGMMTKPYLSGMSTKEKLELYLKLVREENEQWTYRST